MKARVNTDVDRYIGSRIRMRRMQMGETQEGLAKGLDLTFQQVQKYEKGANRVSCSRLLAIASLLRVTPSFFLEGAPHHSHLPEDSPTRDIDIFLTNKDGLTIAQNFMKLQPDVRNTIADLVVVLAK